MQRSQSWKVSWDVINNFNKRHVYETEPEPPPPYEEDAPEFNWDDLPASKPELLCSRCMPAILKVYSNRNGTNAFGLFSPVSRTCVLCRLIAEIQDASALDHNQRVLDLMRIRVPFPDLSRAPPAHMKDLVIFWNQHTAQNLELGASIVSTKFEEHGIRAIPRQQLDPSTIKAWLSECENNHGDVCCSASTRHFNTERKIWLIDTRHFCLVQKSLPTRYVALSYVWGKMQTFRLQERHIPSLSSLEGLRDIEDQLPEIIINAIEFVRSIGEPFLWVDAVCIPQDNAKEMEAQISHMASVYRTAILTLVAVSSQDASSMLPGVRPGTRALPSFLETPDFTLAERTSSILPVLLSSKYHTRAWTFQERLLSTRCVYFTEEQVFLQCQSGIFREDRMVCTPFDKLGRDVLALKPLSPEYIEANSPTGLTGLAKNFQLYKQIVEEYTTKSLSFEADILHAFIGVAEELGPLIQSPLCAAMPERFFFRAMLFQAKHGRFTKRTAEMKHIDKRSLELIGLAFPSWSWCGWIGAVEYRNVGSIITHSGQVQVCTVSRTSAKQLAEYRSFEKSVEPQTHGYELDVSGSAKLTPDVDPYAVRFMAQVDIANCFKLEPSSRGDVYLSITGPNGLTCGLVRLDDPSHGRKQSISTKPKLMRKDTRGPGLILLCDIEQDLVQRSEESNPVAKSKPWAPKLYMDGSPWKLCAVLYVRWHGGTAERLGIGEIVKDDWDRASTPTQLVYLV